MRAVFSLIVTAIALSGCAVDPQAAAERRATLINAMFPAPADRRGIFLAFTNGSAGSPGVWIEYLPDLVSQPEITRRVAGYCARINTGSLSGQVGIKSDMGATQATLADGRAVASRTVVYQCLSAA